MNIVQEANRLLANIRYNKSGTARSTHCEVKLVVKPLPPNDKAVLQQGPLCNVTVYVRPLLQGKDYDLFVKAANQRRGLTFTNCTCVPNYSLGLSRDSVTPNGISVSFVHKTSCLKSGFKLQLNKDH